MVGKTDFHIRQFNGTCTANTIHYNHFFFTQVITLHMRKYTKNMQGGSQLGLAEMCPPCVSVYHNKVLVKCNSSLGILCE